MGASESLLRHNLWRRKILYHNHPVKVKHYFDSTTMRIEITALMRDGWRFGASREVRPRSNTAQNRPTQHWSTCGRRQNCRSAIRCNDQTPSFVRVCLEQSAHTVRADGGGTQHPSRHLGVRPGHTTTMQALCHSDGSLDLLATFFDHVSAGGRLCKTLTNTCTEGVAQIVDVASLELRKRLT